MGFKKAVAYYVPIYLNFQKGEEAFNKVMENPRYSIIPEDKKAVVKEKYVGLFEELQKEQGGLGLDFDGLYFIAYK